MNMLRPCLEKTTGNIVLLHVESVDLSKFEVIYDAKEGNRGTVDVSTGTIVDKPSSFSEQSQELAVNETNAKIEEAVAKNPTKGKKK